MKTEIFRTIVAIILMSYCCAEAKAQLEGLRIETYYIADSDDATDTIGGLLEEDAVTYRIFADMLPATRLLALYGDVQHPLFFASDYSFFNHREEGITFGKDLSKNRYSSGTTPLDTYITLGQCSKSFAQGAYFGTPKVLDQDGSVVGGVNNDGGSAQIASGLLKNGSAAIGLPLTQADGLSFTSALPNSWIDIGFINVSTGIDTTIFGLGTEKQFLGTNALLRNSGVSGTDEVQNEVLVAQLTTKGEIAFELNLEVEVIDNGIPRVIKYVARNESLENGEVFHPLLKYPYACGCTDPSYLEASTTFACTDNSKCLTPVVLGCMDSLACNFDPHANYTPLEREPYDALCDRYFRAVEMAVRYFRTLERSKLALNSESFRDLLGNVAKWGVISDVDLWFRMRDLRNRIAHDYLPDELAEIYGLIFGAYGPELLRVLAPATPEAA